MQVQDISDHMELMRIAAELQKQERDVEYEVSVLLRKLKPFRDELNALRDKRDHENQNVKGHIEAGEKYQAQRNTLHKQIQELKKERRTLIDVIKNLAGEISEHKTLRDQLNEEARGRADTLHQQYRNNIIELLTVNIPVKEEKHRYQRIVDLWKRLTIKSEADAIQTTIQADYDSIKTNEQRVAEINETLQKLTDEAQDAHNKSLEAFKKKEETRALAQQFHDSFVERLNSMKGLQTELDEKKNKLNEIRNEREKISKRLGKIGQSKNFERTIGQLASAKAKMEKRQGLGLEDLRVLLDSGALKIDDGSKPGTGKRGSKPNQ